MSEIEIQNLFDIERENCSDFEISKKNLQKIIETIELMEEYKNNEKILRIYALATGSLFFKNGLEPWKMAENSVRASELYLSRHYTDYEVNYNYLTVTEMTFKFEQSYERALDLYQSDDKKLRNLAVQFLSHLTFYQEGLISKNEYERYNAEYQTIMTEKNYHIY